MIFWLFVDELKVWLCGGSKARSAALVFGWSYVWVRHYRSLNTLQVSNPAGVILSFICNGGIMSNKILAKTNLTVSRQESGFDRACEMAYHLAIAKFGVDDCGHFDRVDGADRSSCSIVVEFKGYEQHGGMCGQSFYYTFEARVEQHSGE